MLTTIFVLSLIKSMAISLGVGGSTMAILNFFHALRDGKIDETERNFMGVTYTVLRVAMVLIASTLLFLSIAYSAAYTPAASNLLIVQVALTALLFINALMMTFHYMPSTFGPAIQAGTWYALGFSIALASAGITAVSLGVYALSYVTFVVFLIALVNGVLAYLKEHRKAV